MRALKELKEKVDNNQLEITQIFAPPRSISTVLEIALTETADGQIHEPFHPRRSSSPNESLELILQRVKKLQNEKGSNSIKLISKDLAKHIDEKDWKLLEKIISNVVFLVREPTLQQFSLIKQRLNEVLMGSYNGNNVSDYNVYDNVQILSKAEWANESWSHLEKLLAIIEKNPKLQEKTIILSETDLTFHPYQTMKELANRLKWFPFNEKTAGNWTKAVGQNFHHFPLKDVKPEFDDCGVLLSGWINKAIRSKNFLKPNVDESQPKSIEKYPKNIQEYFLEEVLPTYVKFLIHPLHIHKNNIDLQELAKINIIEAYILLIFKNSKTQKEIILLQNLKLRLKNEYPLIFERLQEIIASNK